MKINKQASTIILSRIQEKPIKKRKFMPSPYMKKSLISTSIILALLIMMAHWLTSTRMRPPTSKADSRELTYVLTEERGTPSFNPLHSDTLLNVVFMEQIVGTLVKYAFDGKSENCLAATWRTSDNGLRYTFTLKEDLRSEDGARITAEAYHKNLLRLFRLYIQANKDIPVFERLRGFSDFRNGRTRDISGMIAAGNTLEFRFTANPDGILEFLSMPYYGFYSDTDFNADGSWKNDRKITATGPWRLTAFNENSVLLQKREDWPREDYPSPDSVNIRMLPFPEAANLPPVRTIINKRIESARDIPPGYKRFLGTPTDLVAVVLSPYRDGPFKSQPLRRSFRAAILHAAADEKISSEISRNTLSFYPGQAFPGVQEISDADFRSWTNRPLSVVTSNALTPEQLKYVKSILTKSADSLGLKLEFKSEDRTKPGWKERLDELKEMDVRVVRVDIGGSYEPWVVRMMFCSRLGVSFPDPSGRIAGLTGDMTDRTTKTAADFERIVSEDAAVIPLFNSAFSWLVSKDIGMDNFSPTANLLRFEKVQLR